MNRSACEDEGPGSCPWVVGGSSEVEAPTLGMMAADAFMLAYMSMFGNINQTHEFPN